MKFDGNRPACSCMIQWSTYADKFSEQALQKEFAQEDINLWLAYAKNLFENDLPIIFDIYHFSDLVGYSFDYVIGASNAQEFYYRKFLIKKKSGGFRVINEPLPSLKEIQSWILNNILEKISVSEQAKAYIKKKSIKDNAKYHRNQNVVLTIDIKDFFGSTKILRIYKVFRDIGYNKAVSTLLANVCCLSNNLPQGAPTSAYLTNIVFKKADARIYGFCKKFGIRYTRYADDLTFSGDFSPGKVINFVKKVLKDIGYKLHSDKIRAMYRHQRQETTGIVVNQKMQTPIELRRKVRQDFYYIKKYGLSAHISYINEVRRNYLKHLIGLCNFILFVNPADIEFKSYLQDAHEILAVNNDN